MDNSNTAARLVVTCLIFCVAIFASADSYLFKPVNIQFDSIASVLDRLDRENRREHINPALISRLGRIAQQSHNAQLESRAFYWRVRATQMSEGSVECIKLLKAARAKCGWQYDYDLARIDYQLAGNYERQCQYLKAYNMLKSTLPVFERHGDAYFLGNAYLLMAQIFIDINDLDNARLVLRLARDNYSRTGFPLNRIYFFEAILSETGAQKAKYYEMSARSGGDSDWGMTVQSRST